MGSQEPSERIAPISAESDAEDAIKVLKLGGVRMDPWQENILHDWMARDSKGKWASSTCGCSIPRQNGKSFVVQGRAAPGMLLFGEQVIYTAHLQKTATETFEEMKAFFESPKIKRHVKEIKTALGREQIILKNGGKIKFLARTRNGGRGQHGDLLIIDEAQEIDENAQASFLPAISASLNPQTVYLGTPPDPTTPGTVFRKIRDNALSRKTSIAWTEFSVPDIGDTHNPERWAKTNPALGRRIQFSTIMSESEQMDPDTFARERLGWWSPVVIQEVEFAIDRKAWEECASDLPKPEGKTAYGVKFSPDGSEVVVAGAVVDGNGISRISLIERRSTSQGIRWLAQWLNERYTKAACVVIDGRNGADVLIDRISDTWKVKGSVIKPKTIDVVNASTLLVTEINERTLTWFRLQGGLDNSARTAVKRPISGGWGFGGEDSCPIEACALALWGVKTSKRNPGRKMRIG